MVRKIIRNPMFLAQECEPATKADAQIAQDLLDTLRDNLDHCVGMCANMIGEKKTIIAVAAGPFQFVMINPVITKHIGDLNFMVCKDTKKLKTLLDELIAIASKEA